MRQDEHEMPEEYKQNLAKLAEFLEAREGYRKQIKDAELRGVQVPPGAKAEVDAHLSHFDQIIDDLEKLLAEEYERHQPEKAKEAQITEKVAQGWVATQHIYLIIKHQNPHLLESFTKQVVDTMDDDMREEFLDAVAILESTKLDTILKGED